MNILVYDVAASTSGALAVLEDFHRQVKNYTHKDINWFFVVSTSQLNDTENITVKKYPWVKKSWWHRLFFEYFIIQKIIKELKIELIFSMQNMIVPFTSVRQKLYVHFAVFFTDYKFGIRENKILWFYQKVLRYRIFKSIKNSSKVIVQTEWMKQACIEKARYNGEKIAVIKPYIDIKKTERQSVFDENHMVTLFYPATPFEYKKHFDILEALRILKSKENNNFRLILTITGFENKYAKKIRDFIITHSLNVELIGNVDRDEIFQIYNRSILIFSSEVESFGLPLLEARMMNSIVFSKNTNFAAEILDGYSNVGFYSTIEELVALLENINNDSVAYKNQKFSIDSYALVEEVIG